VPSRPILVRSNRRHQRPTILCAHFHRNQTCWLAATVGKNFPPGSSPSALTRLASIATTIALAAKNARPAVLQIQDQTTAAVFDGHLIGTGIQQFLRIFVSFSLFPPCATPPPTGQGINTVRRHCSTLSLGGFAHGFRAGGNIQKSVISSHPASFITAGYCPPGRQRRGYRTKFTAYSLPGPCLHPDRNNAGLASAGGMLRYSQKVLK